eukprot:GILK01005407.1.p1 GENE.GILK01005407.1~~GILK01005407.1.p1  ORF type:complete len:1022 (-),score=208.71 GILK01005407.1:19-3084(-)
MSVEDFGYTRVDRDIDGCRRLVAEARHKLPFDAYEVARIHCTLGSALTKKGELEEATVEFREAVRLTEGKDASMKLHLGRSLMRLKQFSKALNEFKQATKTSPDSSRTHFNLGRVLYLQYAESLAPTTKTTSSDPKISLFPSKESQPLDKEKTLEEALTQLREAIRIDARHAKSHLFLAKVLLARHEAEDAEEAGRVAMRLAPLLVDVHRTMSDIHLEKGDMDSAIAEFREVLRIEPHNAAAHAQLAKLLQSNDDVNQAVKQFQLAIKMGLNDQVSLIEAHRFIAESCFNEGKYYDAIESLTFLSMNDHQNAKTFYALGLALAKTGDYQGAIGTLQHTVELDSVNVRFQTALCETLLDSLRHIRGDKDTQLKRRAAAEALARQAMSISPHDAKASLCLGRAITMDIFFGHLYSYERPKADKPHEHVAYECLLQSVVSEPDNAEIQFLVGRTMRDLAVITSESMTGEFFKPLEKAVLHLREACRLKSGDTLYHSLLTDLVGYDLTHRDIATPTSQVTTRLQAAKATCKDYGDLDAVKVTSVSFSAEAALELLDYVLKSNPLDKTALGEKVRRLMDLGRQAEANELLFNLKNQLTVDQWEEFMKDYHLPSVLEMLKTTGRWREFKRFFDTNPQLRYSDFRIGYLNALLRTGSMEEALGRIQMTIDLALIGFLDMSMDLLKLLLKACRANGKMPEAIQYIRRAIEEAESESSQGHAKEANILRYYLGKALYYIESYEEALACFQHANKTGLPSIQANKADVYMGDILLRKGRYEDAIKKYNLVIENDNSFKKAHFGMGAALEEKRKIEHAILKYKDAVEIDPSYMQARYRLGVCLRKKGRFADALEQFRETVVLNNEFAEGYIAIGETLIELNKVKKAAADLEWTPKNLNVQSVLAPEEMMAGRQQINDDLVLDDHMDARSIASSYMNPVNNKHYQNGHATVANGAPVANGYSVFYGHAGATVQQTGSPSVHGMSRSASRSPSPMPSRPHALSSPAVPQAEEPQQPTLVRSLSKISLALRNLTQ